MATISRIVVLIVLLVGVVFCGIVIKTQAEKVDTLSSQVTMLQASVESLRATVESSQTATTKSIDDLADTVEMHDRLITELERMINSQ